MSTPVSRILHSGICKKWLSDILFRYFRSIEGPNFKRPCLDDGHFKVQKSNTWYSHLGKISTVDTGRDTCSVRGIWREAVEGYKGLGAGAEEVNRKKF